METSAASDSELLADWVAHRREAAFHALVERYATLVHMAAKRTCDGDASLAADASQLVFILLAQKAKSLTSHPTLAGWLHVTAVLKSRDLIDKARRESRKRRHFSAAMENQPAHPAGDAWKEMQPVLDDALASLSAKDREALLLRFYRSLTVREIAATLGIATDAAQKRIDRATDRLRGKLARRGCQSGASLAAAMVAGFAADAQAVALPVSILSAKAIAAGSVGGGFLPATATLLTAMKSASLIPPLAALILAGTWIVTHRQSIYALDRQSSLLEAAISDHSSTATANSVTVKSPSMSSSNSNAQFDWMEISDRLAQANPPGYFSDVDQMLFDQRLGSLSKEELLAALDEVAGLDIPETISQRMEEMLIFPMSVRFPEFTVTRLTSRFQAAVGTCPFYLSDAFKRWARKDYKKASEWMNQQKASGTFDTKSLDGKNWLKNQFESRLLRVELTQDKGIAEQHLTQLPTHQREDAIISLTQDMGYVSFKTEERDSFIRLVRDFLPAASQADAFGKAASQMSGNLSAVTDLVKKIHATPAERALCVENAATSHIGNISINRKVTRDDIGAVREWIATQMPDAVDRFTGAALGIAAQRNDKMSFAEASDFAVQFTESAGSDDLLATFLQSDAARSNKVQARALAEKISDDALRAEVLKGLE